MKCLTKRKIKASGYYMACSETCRADCMDMIDCEELEKAVDWLGAVEDILGDEYDLDRLREIMKKIDSSASGESSMTFTCYITCPDDCVRSSTCNKFLELIDRYRIIKDTLGGDADLDMLGEVLQEHGFTGRKIDTCRTCNYLNRYYLCVCPDAPKYRKFTQLDESCPFYRSYVDRKEVHHD